MLIAVAVAKVVAVRGAMVVAATAGASAVSMEKAATAFSWRLRCFEKRSQRHGRRTTLNTVRLASQEDLVDSIL